LEKNTIVLPSGDHAGSESYAGSFVSWKKPLPSALIAQMSWLPASISQPKIRRPLSGDHAGRDPPLTPTFVATRATLEPSGFMR
jgi:hypothetical protein